MRSRSGAQTEVLDPVHRGIIAAAAENDSEMVENERQRGTEGKWSKGPDEEAELRVEAGGERHKLVEGRGVDPAAEEPGPGGEGGPDPSLPAGRLRGNVHCKNLDGKKDKDSIVC